MLVSSDFNQNGNVATNFSNKSQIQNFTKIRTVGVALFHFDWQTDKHEEVSFSQLQDVS
jgi:hypothetical protein